MSLEQVYQNKIVSILSALFPEARIILFGSRAKNTHASNSDIDIAIDAGKMLPRVAIGEARDMLGESTIPYKIDVVDVYGVSEAMRAMILNEGIVWKS